MMVMANSSESVDRSQDVATAPGKAGVVKAASKSISFNIVGQPAQAPKAATEPQAMAAPARQTVSQLPIFPRRKRPTFSRHRHDANPALALKVLQDIQLAVDAWHTDLKQTVQAIQALYMEGPIVDGWLEAIDHTGQQAPKAVLDAALLRHADPQQLSNYVEQLCESLEAEEPSPSSPAPERQPDASYRLCSLDADGQLQAMPCPPEQLYTVSLAIARHQKLRQLIDHKQYLEARLKRAVETLSNSRDNLGIPPTCNHQEPLEA
jgi:hypothetical protein